MIDPLSIAVFRDQEDGMTNTIGNDEMLDVLRHDATDLRPRLFAVYGIYRGERDTFLGWGMDFGDDQGALFYEPYSSTTWHSDSAEQVLRTHQVIGDARLDWLDQP